VADKFIRLDFESAKIRSSTITTEPVESIPQVLSRVSHSSIFWSMLIGKIMLMTVGQFISYIPLYLTTGVKLEASKAAMCAASFSTGSLVSNLLGAKYYSKLPHTKQLYTVLISNGLASICTLLLTCNAAAALPLSVPQILALLMVWGATWAAAFYVPPGLVALELGGVQHAALITNVRLISSAYHHHMITIVYL
jgi:predicted MFS family arabinose efflux permease